MNQPRRQRPARDRKIVFRALGLRAVIGLGRDADLAHRIALDAKLAHGAFLDESLPGDRPEGFGRMRDQRIRTRPTFFGVRPSTCFRPRKGFQTVYIIAICLLFTKSDDTAETAAAGV